MISSKNIFRKKTRRKEITVDHSINIKKYGFSEIFSSKLSQDSPLEPARVLSQEKGFYRIIKMCIRDSLYCDRHAAAADSAPSVHDPDNTQ